MGNVGGSLFQHITESTLQVDDILSSPYPYEQQLVKVIHRDIVLDAKGPMDVLEHPDKVIKIEGMEKLCPILFQACKNLAEVMEHDGPVTCHLFLSPAGGKSFPTHTDPDDVFLYMVSGVKHMAVNDSVKLLTAGDSLLIPRNTPHRAHNLNDSKMLSFGLERFIVEKL